ncbi:hypothetical protein [Microbulbifer sp. MCCC 1A16149]|uniref:hypothetical protein n=1 Tax=Microbulbifer sp. MCCC 1A16149 TaxID=3411322 RepID=UPI003D11EB7D
MNPRKFAAAFIACAIAGTALATEQSDVSEEAEVMEHVEVIGYPTPAITATETSVDKDSIAEQMVKQQRQELLRSTEAAQLQQLEAFRLEGENLSGDTLAQEAPPQLEQLEPAEVELDEEASSIDPVQESEIQEEPLQEPS